MCSKLTTRIFLGWKHKDNEEDPYVQVRLKEGGGTRTPDVAKSATYDDVLDVMKNLFLPGGISPKGAVGDMECKISSFQEDIIKKEEFVNVGCHMEKSAVRPMRLYLLTNRRNALQNAGQVVAENQEYDEDGSLPDTGVVHAEQTLAPEDSNDSWHISFLDQFESGSSHDVTSETLIPAGTPTVTLRRTTDSIELCDVLHTLSSQVEHEGIGNPVNVVRYNVLDGLFRALLRKRFNPKRRMFVQFSHEDGVDGSGPSRELFRLALQEIQNSCIFHGKRSSRFIEMDYKALEEDRYFCSGLFIAYLLVHNGPLPQFLHPVLYSFLATGKVTHCSVEEVEDEGIKSKIKAIADATTQENYQDVTNDPIVDLAGCTALGLSLKDRDNLVTDLVHFFIIGRHGLAISQ
ncbi:uncharacterized protein LOC106167284 [Lingula anatina]|uniref:Uncharacterized protein LOC106167284 n=1 Tax=Lingula anatina TaxID=7574 RepID=A0A1S3ITD3_LINAN|nr:uncharacterized protein LOC106167284 [Lingula anatina]|eukprot:XP_013401470.1 uncharacterized protein LOC106167284 [Lingula anatina]